MSLANPRIARSMDCYEQNAALTRDGHIMSLNVLILLREFAQTKVDRENDHGAWLYLSALDNMDIYGEDINVLYKFCGGDIIKFAAVLRGWQMCLFSEEEIKNAIEWETCARTEYFDEKLIPRLSRTMDFVELLQTVLPSFDPRCGYVLDDSNWKGSAFRYTNEPGA